MVRLNCWLSGCKWFVIWVDMLLDIGWLINFVNWLSCVVFVVILSDRVGFVFVVFSDRLLFSVRLGLVRLMLVICRGRLG